MQFMVLVKANEDSEAGAMPSEQLLTQMGQYNEELVKAGVLLAGEGLHPSSKGVRVKFARSTHSVTDGPFTETKELVAGFWLWQVGSKQEAIEWLKRCPNPHSGESEIEIREAGCVGGLTCISPSNVPAPQSAKQRYMVLLKADRDFEAGVSPGEKVLAAMAQRNEEGVKDGVLLAAQGLQPSAKGARVKFSGSKRTIVDGPFTETKELVAGFWLIQVDSQKEAIEWVKRYPYPHGPKTEFEVEIRKVFEASDFGAEFTPELQQQEERIRLQAAAQQQNY